MATTAADRPLNATQVADLFGVSAATVASWADQGKLPHFKTPSGRRRFRRAEVEAFIAAEADEPKAVGQ